MLVIIARSLCVLKSCGTVCIKQIVENFKSLGYKVSDAYDDVWLNRYFNNNGDPYYKYVLCYVFDLLQIGFKPN